MADLDYEGFWKETLIQLRNDLGEEEFSGWFSNLKYLHARFDEKTGKNSIVIGVPSAFHRDKVSSRYKNAISSTLQKLSDKDITIDFELNKKSEAKPEKKGIEPVQSTKKESISAEKTTKTKIKRENHPQLRDDYTFKRYVIGENNKFPANAAIAISENPGKAYNPFLIYGGVGLGKTHLMQAIGNYIHENTENEVIYITSENFLNEYLEGLKPQEHGRNTMKSFKNKYRYTDVLLIDDIQFFTDKPGVQEELFHTFNELLDAKKQIVFTCDRPITELKKFPERLISRFGLGLMADLQPPRYEERCAILKSEAENKKVSIPNEVIDLLSNNISSNIRDLIAALTTLIAYTQLMGKPITLEIAQQRLKTIFNSPRPTNLSMDNVIRVVAESFGLTPNDLKGKKRTQNIAFARQLAMYIGRRMTDYSYTEIGQDFGGRDHSTVLHSINKIEDKLITDSTLESTIESLKRSIKEFSAKY
ncbi:MAG: chromosomal replication initiator protein DnaA [Treponema sp.]|jgi:chromosomal replication initiator protein|nr:chromosomal replication initiator protein DnaA [Treponema sp.]